MPCRECGAPTLVHDDVGSLVCTRCGTLADPSQSVLATTDTTTTFTPSYCTSKRWHLTQTKQDRDKRNTFAMNTFISSILSRLNNPGLSPRAEAIFTQAMSKGNLRWGRRAKLTAGSSIAIALREAHKSDSLRDIAFFLDDSPVSLARAFQSVLSLLDFSLDATDPAVHLPILHAHLHSAIHPETLAPSQLPDSLVSILTHLSLQAAVRTATTLSHIVSQHSPPLDIVRLPTPPTACALLVLGLEAEARAPLPHLKELTRTLATRFALAPGVVSSRYKILYDLIEEWIRHVPWLDQFVYKGKGRGPSARSKVPKRAIVARGIKDVVQFHQEIWLSRMQSQQKVILDMEPDPGDDDDDLEEEHDPQTVASSSKRVRGAVTAVPPGKRRKIGKEALYPRLLDPLSSGALDAATFNDDMSLLNHLLTCSPDELSHARGSCPTRLQLLAASRGGSTAEHITDRELFTEGELDGLLRDEREREALLPLFQLNWSDAMSQQDSAVRPPHKSTHAETKRGAERVDMDALARLLGHDDDRTNEDNDDAVLPDQEECDWDEDTCQHSSEHHAIAESIEPISDWRTGQDGNDIFGGVDDAVEDWYEEEL